MMRRPGSALRICLVLAAGSFLMQSGPAQAQYRSSTSTIGGFEGSAEASGLLVVYNPEGVLPIPPPVDLSSPDVLTTIASGPSTFARASMADPGDLLANPDALLSAGSEDYPSGAIPPYPYRISASSGTGAPTAKSTPAPGFEATAAADSAGSQAEATTPKASAPAILTIGSLRSHATTHTDGSTVTVEAGASLSNLDLLGVLTIKGVSTELAATSDGTTTKTSGGTVITGATVLGQPVTIDAEGIHPRDGAGGAESAIVEDANDALSALGLRVTVASPIEQESPTAGQLISAGLRIDVEVSDRTYPQLGDVLDLLPPLPPLIPGAPGGDDVLALVRARHLGTISIGQAQVSVAVRTLEDVPEPPVVNSVDPPAVEPIEVDTPVEPVSPDPLPTETTTPITTDRPDEALRLGFAEGIGLLAVLGLLLQPLLADRISRGAASLLRANSTDSCLREGT
jgi:hypothetical protein